MATCDDLWPRFFALESTDKKTYAGTNYAFAPEISLSYMNGTGKTNQRVNR